MFDCQKGADEIHLQHVSPVVAGEIEQRDQSARDTGVGEEHLQTAEVRDTLTHQLAHDLFFAGRPNDGPRPSTGFLDRSACLLEPPGVEVVQDDGRTLARKEDRARAADTTGRARHDGALTR